MRGQDIYVQIFLLSSTSEIRLNLVRHVRLLTYTDPTWIERSLKLEICCALDLVAPHRKTLLFPSFLGLADAFAVAFDVAVADASDVTSTCLDVAGVKDVAAYKKAVAKGDSPCVAFPTEEAP